MVPLVMGTEPAWLPSPAVTDPAGLVGAFSVRLVEPDTSAVPPTTADTAGYSLAFSDGATYTASPVTNADTTVTFEVSDTSSTGIAASNVPYVIYVNGVETASSTIPSIAADGTAPVLYDLQEATPGNYTVEMIIDPNNTTGAAGQTDDTQSVVIPVAQSVVN